MKKLVAILVILSSLSFHNNEVDEELMAVLVSSESSLEINGSTNLNTFNCTLNFEAIDAIVTTNYFKNGNKINFRNTALKLENNCFDCGNRMMNKDFRKMLNSDVYPYVTLELQEIAVNPLNRKEVYAYTIISMAGVSKTYSIPLNVQFESRIDVTGCLSLKLTDFGITPPRKALGFIMVSNDFDINLDLRIEPLNQN